MTLDHAKLKAVFEKALPPITDSSSLALRCCLLQLRLRPPSALRTPLLSMQTLQQRANSAVQAILPWHCLATCIEGHITMRYILLYSCIEPEWLRTEASEVGRALVAACGRNHCSCSKAM